MNVRNYWQPGLLYSNAKKRGTKEMRTLEAIDRDLAAAREALSHVKGTPAEVYSRIVGYYRSVRNWNKGKREEYGERKLFRPDVAEPSVSFSAGPAKEGAPVSTVISARSPAESRAPALAVKEEKPRLLLFVRSGCPACPSAKAAAGQLGIPVDLVNADTADGMAEAARHQVYATPTAILFNPEGLEIERALDSRGIAALDKLAAV
jgi:ribonucleoside-triphosphate reductase